MDTSDPAAVRRFDRKRPGRKTKNDEWKNPHDPDAKIGRTKRGATRMIYEPEHVVDLETGAIVDADVRPGDEHDTEDLTERLLAAEIRMLVALGEPKDTERVEMLAADKGYFKLEEIALLQGVGIETAVSDPQSQRRLDKLGEMDRAALETAKRTIGSEIGKALLKRRAELVERGFQLSACARLWGRAPDDLARPREHPQALPDPGGVREPLASHAPPHGDRHAETRSRRRLPRCGRLRPPLRR